MKLKDLNLDKCGEWITARSLNPSSQGCNIRSFILYQGRNQDRNQDRIARGWDRGGNGNDGMAALGGTSGGWMGISTVKVVP